MQNQHEREQSIGTMSKSMLIVVVFTMISKVTGFLRETVLASQYGAGEVASAFKTAQLLPCIFLSVIVTAISATLIPVYSTEIRQGKEKANRFINNLMTVGLLASIVILLLTGFFMDKIAGFVMMESSDEGTRALALQLAMVLMPMGIFVFLARVTSAYLQANFNFVVPAISQLFLNVVIIAAILISRGENIMIVAIGMVLGWALQFLVQIPAMRRTGLRARPVIDFKESGLREVLILMLPVLISSTFDQVYLMFDQMVAYRGAVGDVSKLDYANRLSTMVSSVLLTTIATVLYPNLVKHVDDKKKFTDDLSFGINLNFLIAIPATIAIIALSLPITRIVYQRGLFSAEDTAITAPLLACYSAGILGIGLRELFNRCFYAYKDTIVPTINGIGVVVLNVVLNYALHAVWGPAGIAAATSISTTLSGLVLMLILQRKRRVLDTKRVFQCLWKTVAATGVMAAVLLVFYRLFQMGTQSGIVLLGGLAISVVVGILAYVVMLRILRTDELGMVIDMLKKKLKRA